MRRIVTDKFKYRHELTKILASGGQGTVWRTKDSKIAVKIAGSENSTPDELQNLAEDTRKALERLSILPIPANIGISVPIAPLEGVPGYSMLLLQGLSSFEEVFNLIDLGKKIEPSEIPEAFKAWDDDEMARRFTAYNKSGGLRRRLLALAKCASELARLNGAGLIYCDVNMNNVLLSDDINNPVLWLIDPDNIRYDNPKGGAILFPGFGAPEICRGKTGNTSQGDVWAFAVAAFKILLFWEHPFEGALMQEYDDTNEGEELAYNGEFPYALDPDDDSNGNFACSVAENVLTPELDALFSRTFIDGKDRPELRPPMFVWPEALARAADLSVKCPVCGSSYYEAGQCVWCDAERPPLLKIDTYRIAPDGSRSLAWHFVHELEDDLPVIIPKRVLAPFFMTDFDTEIFTLTRSENSVIMIRPEIIEDITLKIKNGGSVRPGFRTKLPAESFSINANIAGRRTAAEVTFS